MTTELEKQFFSVFGIEPKLLFYDLTRLKEDTNQEMGGRCTANWQGETKEDLIKILEDRIEEIKTIKESEQE